MRKTRLFYVIDSATSNEELFATLEEAIQYHNIFSKEDKPRMYIAEVRNSFQEDDGEWNYSDLSDTFTIIKMLDVYKIK